MFLSKRSSEFRRLGLSTLLLLLGCCWLIPHGDFRQPGVVPQFWLGATVMGLGFVLSWRVRSLPSWWFWGVAILARLLLLFMYPGDDVWRYLWEGYIQTQGFSPYVLAPMAPELIPLRTDWWDLMNHLHHAAIYPPIAQLGFRALATLTPAVWLFKSAFIAADLAICGVLSRRFGYSATLFYAWNPLVIYSFAGGAHYDSWFILPLVTAWLLLDPTDTADQTSVGLDPRFTRPPGPSPLPPPSTLNDQSQDETDRQAKSQGVDTHGNRIYPWTYWAGGGLLIGISIAVKWISLPILGFLSWRALRCRQWRSMVLVLICALLPLGLSALPFCDGGFCPVIPLGTDFATQARSADLIPRLVQLVWPPTRYQNWIFAIPMGLAVLGLLWRIHRFRPFTEWYLFLLLLFAPVVHAWYFTWVIPFAVASRNLGVRLVSLSVFVYFVLQQRIALGGEWLLTPVERILIWLPFVLGWGWSVWQQGRDRPPASGPQLR